jgi:hypothetical protein
VINPGARARQINTAKIDSFPALERGVAVLREECARAGRAQLPQFCAVQARGAFLRGRQFYDDLTRLEEVGVALVCLAPEGDTVPDLFAGGSSGSRPPSRLYPARPVPPMPDHEIPAAQRRAGGYPRMRSAASARLTAYTKMLRDVRSARPLARWRQRCR